MIAIDALEQMGYSLTLEGESIRCKLTGELSDPLSVRKLLAELKSRKSEAIAYLRLRHLPQRIPLDELYKYDLPDDVRRTYYRLE